MKQMSEFRDQNWAAPVSVLNPPCDWNGYPKNKYIYVKQRDETPNTSSKIWVNPHFKDNTKVFLNPNFTAEKNIQNVRPSIHINPNVIKSVPPTSTSLPPISVNSAPTRYPLEKTNDNSGKVLVSTKNKLIKIHNNSNELKIVPTGYTKQNSVLSSKYKKINITHSQKSKQFEERKIFSTQLEIFKTPKSKQSSPPIKRNSIITRFKYISSNKAVKKFTKLIRSKHKIINVNSNTQRSKTIGSNLRIEKTSPNSRKRYVYINKFNSSSFLANNVILKNTRRNSLINVNGILYHNSANVMKKAQIYIKNSPNKSTKLLKNFNSDNNKNTIIRHKRASLVQNVIKQQRGKYKFIRSAIATPSKLKKSNVPCPVFKRFGKCRGQKTGSCIKIHNPDQIILCTKFLQGACIKKNCLLSHKVSPEKMPTCKYYLEGLCLKDDCQYLHVKISPKAEICKEFLQGFCRVGIQCNKRHQFLCPEFESSGKCPKKRCEYPHITNTKPALKSRSKTFKKNNKQKEFNCNKEDATEKSDKPNIRYYNDIEIRNETEGTLITKRDKIDSLPVFIPLTQVGPENT